MSFSTKLNLRVLFIFARAGLRKTVDWFLIFESTIFLIVFDRELDKMRHQAYRWLKITHVKARQARNNVVLSLLIVVLLDSMQTSSNFRCTRS